MKLDISKTYVHLAKAGKATTLQGGEAFWTLPPAELDRYGQGWLITEYEFTADWTNWEMHPNADEFVYLLSGSVEILLDRAEGQESITLENRGAIVVPRGVWHTARVRSPSLVLHVTMGAGTEHRPVETDS